MSHRVLVIGSGGREHAICWKLSQSPKVAQIYALPGSHGIQLVEKCRNLDAKTLDPKDFEVGSLRRPWSDLRAVPKVTKKMCKCVC